MASVPRRVFDPMSILTPSERRAADAYIADGYAPSWCEGPILAALMERDDLTLSSTIAGGWQIERAAGR